VIILGWWSIYMWCWNVWSIRSWE